MFQKVGLVVYKYIGNIVVLFIHFHYNYLANTLHVLYIFLHSITDGSQTDKIVNNGYILVELWVKK